MLKGEGPGRANLEDLFDKGEFFVTVDWSKTRAYAMGLGDIYINLKGREGQGIVEPGEPYQALLAELKARLEGYVDEETGEHPVAYVWTRDEAYGVYDPELIPDLFASNGEGYRVGWQDTLGIVAKNVVEPNRDIWSADHCSVYPPLVNGILFCNRQARRPGPLHGRPDADDPRAPGRRAAGQARRRESLAARGQPAVGSAMRRPGSAKARQRRRAATLSALFTALVLLASGAPAPAAPPASRERELEEIRLEITRLHARLGEVRDQAADLAGQVERTGLELALQEQRVAEAATARDLSAARAERQRRLGGGSRDPARGGPRRAARPDAGALPSRAPGLPAALPGAAAG